MDASGHTLWDRLGIFARRAAPVQISYVGYWSTTGLTEMDWVFPDPGCDAGYDAHFTEGLWRLPRLTVSYNGDRSLPESGWKPDPDGTVWLGSFNRYSKIRKQTLALWAGVLHALPEAKLLFEDSAVHEEETHQRILTVLAGHGIEAGRVEFIPYIRGHERHMVLYDRLDIALDTVPFNSGTTAYDALWMGVPLVALEGDWVGGRMGSGYPDSFRSAGVDRARRGAICCHCGRAGARCRRPKSPAPNPARAHGCRSSMRRKGRWQRHSKMLS